MRRLSAVTLLFVLTGGAAFGADATAASVLQKVSEKYKTLKTYDIKAEVHISVVQNGLSGSSQGTTRLAVGPNGAFPR